MEILSTPFYVSLNRYWKRRRYQRLDGAITGKKNLKIVRLGGGNNRRSWKIRAIPKLRLKIFSPVKLLAKLRDAYVNMMLGLSGKGGYLSNENVFGGGRIPKTRPHKQVQKGSSAEEFNARLVFEIYKSLKASRELAVF